MKSYNDFISESEQLNEKFRVPGRIRIPGRGPRPPGRGPKPGKPGKPGPRGPGGGGGNPIDAIGGAVQNFAGGLLGGMVWDGLK